MSVNGSNGAAIVDGSKGIAIYSAIAVLAVFVLAVLRLTQDQGGFTKSQDLVKAQVPEQCLRRQTIPAGTILFLADASKTTPLEMRSAGPLKLNSPEHKGTDARKNTSDVVRLSNQEGSFEILSSAEQLVLTKDDQSFVLKNQSKGKQAFGPAPGATYAVWLGLPVPAPGETTGKLVGGENLPLVTLQPISVLVLPEATSVLMPTWVTGQPGMSDVAVEINKPGLQLDAAGNNLTACATTKGGWAKAGIAAVKAGLPGSARVTLALPDDALPGVLDGFKSVSIMLVTLDGGYVAVGSFNAVGKGWAAGISVLLTVALLAPLMYSRGQHLKKHEPAVTRWFSGLFFGPDGDPSLSLLQVLIWSIITLWGFFYVFIVSGDLLVLTPQVMALLGLAGAGSVLARWITVSSGGSTSQGPGGQKAYTGNMFWQMLSTNGQFDLLKLQLFAFTVVIALYVVARILDSAAFPELDPNTLLLMGVSQGVYVAGKLASTDPLVSAQAKSAEINTLKEALARYQNELASANEAKAGLEDQIKTADVVSSPKLKENLASATKTIEEKTAVIAETNARIASIQVDLDKIFAQLGFTKVQKA